MKNKQSYWKHMNAVRFNAVPVKLPKMLFWYQDSSLFAPFTTEHYDRKCFWRQLHINPLLRQGKKRWDAD